MKFFCSLLLSLPLLILLNACAPKESAIAKDPSSTYYPIHIDGATAQLQLALTQSEQSKGLMHRDSMPDDHGMLFLFQQPGPLSFWMRNTRIPLDIGYFDASGKLVEIHSLYPYDENAVPSRSQELLIAVETNRGWFAANRITPGAQLDLDAIKTAVIRRGKSPDNYALQTAP
jgi:uncharacterized membrane protein (UPF0127 family)